MSVLDVLATVRDCLADPSVGLARRVEQLAAEPSPRADPEQIRTEFNFVQWKLSGAVHPQTTTQPNVMLRPVRWRSDATIGALRDGVVVIQVGVEWFDADTAVLQDNITIGAVALARVMDGLREFSDTHQGTVIDVKDPIDFAFGEFDGPASSGFLATIEIEERSTSEPQS
jgi:hypothetical protein